MTADPLTAMLPAVLSLLGGLVLLVIAADWTVDGAVAIARRLGVSLLVVGLTIVAYGTSFPELVVAVLAVRRGVDDLVIGNLVGSNLANLGLVLGATALVAPLAVRSRALFTRDLPLLIAVTGLAVAFLLDGRIGRLEGAVLLGCALAFTLLCLRQPETEPEAGEPPDPWVRALGLLILGIAGLLAGAHFLVEGSRDLARHFGVSERIIGLTIVAFGTSLPELAAGIAGTLRGHPGLAVGNVVGSSLFNMAFVLGSAAQVAPLTFPLDAIRWDLAAMVSVTLLAGLLLRRGRRLGRAEGALLLAVYLGFMAWVTATAAPIRG